MNVQEYMIETMSAAVNYDFVDEKLFHKTQLMLRIYRKVLDRVKAKLDYIGVSEYEGDSKKIYNMVDSMYIVGDDYKVARLDELLFSIEESKVMLVLMDKSLELLKLDDERGNIEYQILYNDYFSPNKIKNAAMMDKLCLSNSTYYRYKRSAAMSFAVNLWGYVLPEILRRKRVS